MRDIKCPNCYEEYSVDDMVVMKVCFCGEIWELVKGKIKCEKCKMSYDGDKYSKCNYCDGGRK